MTDTMNSQRIVSLLPSATEILFDIGAGEKIVGISEDCDWPPEIKDLPRVSSSPIDNSATSSEIDQQVKEHSHTGKSLYHVKEKLLNELDPDLIITQEQCDVCAPTYSEVNDVCKRVDGSPEIISLEARTLDGVLRTIEILGEATDQSTVAKQKIEALKNRQKNLRDMISSRKKNLKVCCLEWIEPLFISGHWIPEMVSEAGANPIGEAGEKSREVSLEHVLEQNPDVLTVMPCGFGLERGVQEAQKIISQLDDVSESRADRISVFAVDSSSYFTRPGPRLWDGLEIMARIVFPELKSKLNLPAEALKHLV